MPSTAHIQLAECLCCCCHAEGATTLSQTDSTNPTAQASHMHVQTSAQATNTHCCAIRSIAHAASHPCLICMNYMTLFAIVTPINPCVRRTAASQGASAEGAATAGKSPPSSGNGLSPTHAAHITLPTTKCAAISPNTSGHDAVRCSTHPVNGTLTSPARVAAVFPAPNTIPACLGAISKWLTLTAPKLRALRPRPTVIRAEAVAAEPPTRGETAAMRQAAGPSMPASCRPTRTARTDQPRVLMSESARAPAPKPTRPCGQREDGVIVTAFSRTLEMASGVYMQVLDRWIHTRHRCLTPQRPSMGAAMGSRVCARGLGAANTSRRSTGRNSSDE
jgi:hypothetical protein